MATVIDSLLVLLSLDPSGFKKGAAEADATFKKSKENADKQSKEMEAKAKVAGMVFDKVRNQVLALTGAFMAGMGAKNFIESLTGTDAAAGRTARNIGISTEKFTAWQGVAERAGGTATGMASSMQGLSQQFQELALKGTSAVVPFFRAVGVPLADANGKMRQMDDILLDLADKFKDMDPARAQALGRGMGLDEGTVNVLMQGRAAVVALLEEQKKLGAANQKDADAAAARQKAMKGLEQATGDLGRKLLTALTPALNKVLEILISATEWLSRHQVVFTVFATVLGVAAGALTVALVALQVRGFLGLIATLLQVPAAAAAAAASLEAGAVASSGSLLKMLGALAGGAALVAAAGAVGYAIGTLIWKGVEDTDLGDKIGGWVTKVLASLGDADAQEAMEIRLNEAAGLGQNRAPGARKGTPSAAPAPAVNRAPASPSTPSGARAGGSAPSDVAEAAKAAEAKYGVPAEVTIAQWKLESANGKHMPAGSNNPFGIKARPGQPYVEADTKEFINGQMRTVKQKFAKYDSIADAFDAHAKLLATGSAYAEARKHTNDPAAYADALTGHYATDPNYGAKLKSLMATNAQQPDPALRGGSATALAANTQTTTNSTSTHSSEVNIKEVNVNVPNAQSGEEVARGLAPELKRSLSLAAQANTGLVG